MVQNPSGKKKNAKPYSKGELNRVIDSLLHPLSDHNPALMVVDGVLHGLVEQKPAETVTKFIRYTLPKIIQEITKNRGK